MMCPWKGATTLVVGGLVAVGSAMAAGSGGLTTITGKIIFKGDPAKYKPAVVDTSKDPKCKEAKREIESERIIIDGKKPPFTLRNVLVSIKSGFGDRVFPVRTRPATLTRKGCRFEPHVLALTKRQPLRILNADDRKGDVRLLSSINKQQTFTFAGKDDKKGHELTFKTERPFKVTSTTHPWMECYIGVFDHPFFDVTGPDGTYTLKGMPPGNHLIEAWHEEFGSITVEVIAKKGEATNFDFTFDLSKKTPAPKPED